MKRCFTVTEDQQTKINRLHRVFEARGIDTRNPKHPESFSDSALIRFLIDKEIAQVDEAAEPVK